MNLVNHSAKSQCAQILFALKHGRKFTSLDGVRWFGTTRIGARIKDLREEGYNIITTMVCENGKRFAVYSMKQLAKSKQ